MQAVASGPSATALGQWTRATGTGAVAIGGNNSSNTAASGAQASGSNAVAIAGQSRATGGEAIAIGVRSSAVNNGDVAIGADSLANGTTSNLAAVAVGRGSRAVGEDAVALGNSARAEAHYGAAIGNFAAVTARNATAIGNSSNASGGAATSIGNFSAASGLNAVAIGGGGVPGSYAGARATGGGAVALGGNQVRGASSAAQDGIALGGESTVDANAASGIAVGRGARAYDNAAYGVALGDGAAARGEHDIVIGRDAATSAQSAGNNIAMGNAVTTGAEGQNVAIGSGSTSAVASDASGGAVAIGRDQKATGNGAVALGDPNTANGDGAVALGQNNVAAGDAAGNSAAQGAVAIGSGNQAIGQGSVALGNASQTAAAGSIALGDSASTEALNGVALGSNAVAANAGDVALGSGSATAAAVGTSQTVINGTTYSFAGTTPSSTVSVGAAGEERTITNVAAGRLSETSTDAINGSQLYATNQAVGTLGTNVNNLGNSTAAAVGAGSSYDPATGQVAPPSFNIAGGNQTNIGDAINALNQGWTLTTAGNATGTSATAIQPGSTMTVTGGNNIQLTQNGSEITVSTSATPTFDSVSINGGPVLSGTGIDMGNRKITNVAAGTDAGDAVNVSQLDNARTRYYSVNDGGLIQGNYNNDGAVGANSIAAGVGATAQSINGVAMGYNARSIGAGGVAVGEYSEAHGESDVYVGGAAGANGQAGNYRNTGVGERAGSNVAGANNTAIGGTTGNNVTGTANFAGGAYSGSNVTGDANIAIGGVGSQCNGSGGILLVGSALMDCDPAEISAGVNVTGSNNIAMGPAAGSNLTGDNNIALGNQAGAGISANNTFAAGTQAAARSDNDIAIGSAAATAAGTGGNNIAIGNGVTTGADGQNVAIGSGSTSANAGDAFGGAVAIGRDQTAIGNGAVALGDPNTANGDGAVALGQNNIAAGDAAGNSAAQGAVAIGSGNQAIGQGSVALGNASQTAAAGSLALGDTARTAALNGVALGSNAIASNAGDVALGAGSATAAAVGTSQVVINGTTYSFAGTAPSSTVSVGAAGEERTITNVAAGRISGTSTDAINGSQLYATNQAVEQAGDTITNIAGDTSQANTDANGMGIRYVRTNEAGLARSDASAQGQGSTAVGYNATATAESALALGRESRSTIVGGVALGAGSVADRALTPSNGSIVVGGGGALVPFNTTDRTLLGAVSVGSGTTYRQITNVADGTDDHDAVTVRQLTGAMTSLTITGTRYFHANSTQEDSLAAGEQSVAIGPNTVVNGEDGIGIGNGAIVEQNAPGGIAMGEGSRVQLADAVALGTKANAAAEQSVALGAGSSATAAGGVALGAGSVAATQAGVAGYVPATQGAAAVNATQSTLAAVSVGDAATGKFRQITGVAAGTVDSDAVNVSQLKSLASNVNDLDAGSVKYDRNPDGTVNYESVTLNPGGAPTTIGNVAAGELSPTSTEAVNGSQLNETNQNVAQIGDTITNIAGDTSQANTDANGMGIRYVRTNEAGLARSDASAQGQGSTAVGYNATATAESALALGREANASHAGSVALGANAVADGATLGTAAYNPGTATIAGITPVGEVSVGSANAERRLTNVAAGATDTDAVNVSQLKAVSASVSDLDAGAVKYDRNADGTINYGSVTLNPSGTGGSQIHNVAAGTAGTDAVNVDQLNQSIETNKTRYYSINDNGQRQANANNDGASGAGALAAGIGAVATGERALSVGNGNSATGARSAAIGSGNSVSGNGSYAYGSDNTIASADAFVIGSGVTVGAGLDGAVILGRGSMAVAATPTQRGIVNGVEYLYAGGNPAAGDVVSVGSADAPRQIQHVAAGRVAADSLDAINGSQLYATNQAVDSLGQVVQNINTGGGIKYFHANGGAGGALPDSQASGAGSVAVGPAAVAAGAGSIAMGNEAAAGAAGTVAIGAGAQANRQGDVALGDGSIADRGAESYTGKYSNAQNDTSGTVSVGAPGAERTVSNVADGRNATDAVNLRQLDGAVKAANDYTDQRIGDVNQSVVEIGDTVNELDGRVAQVEGDVTKLKNGSDGMFQVSQDAGNMAPRAEGQNSVAGGAGAVASGNNGTAIGNSATASGSNSTAMGSGAKASGENATAMGNGSKAEANNSVALGAGSVADRNDTVSVGAAGAERQIVNVAPGTAGTDAVNVNQLRDVEGNLSNQIASVKGDLRRQDNRLSAGVASAMAMSALPQAYLPGKSMFSMGGGTWRGESGFAMGLSTVSDNGRWVVKGLASSSSRGDYGASVGVGYQW